MKTPVNRETLSQHFTYSWWKYLLLAVLTVGLVDVLYSVTAYRTPEEKKVDFYIYGYADTDRLNAYMENIRLTGMQDMEEMSSTLLMADDTYGPMQLTTYMAVGEGDLYLLPRENFLSMASSGAFLPLEDEQELMDLFSAAGISLQAGWRRLEDSGESHLYGIPQDKLPGLASYCVANNGYLCVLAAGKNDANSLKFLRILAQDMLTAPEGSESVPSASDVAPASAEAPASP